MATLREIRKRIHTAQNIKQITKAMEMVAAARLRRAQIKAEQARPYMFKMKYLVQNLADSLVDFRHPLLEKREVKKIGVVIVAADRGLCGSYNAAIISAAERFIKKYNPEAIELILIGRKAIEHFKRKKWQIRSQVSDWGGKVSFSQVKTWTQQLMDGFLSQELDEIWLVYAHYVNIISRNLVVEKFLNIEQNERVPGIREDYLFEPTLPEIYSQLLSRYAIAKIQAILNEAHASELSARIFSMHTATKNADEMIERLTLVRNKVRQANITREMVEITSGAEGLK